MYLLPVKRSEDMILNDELHWNPLVDSDANMYCFHRWFKTATLAQLQFAYDKVYEVNHRRKGHKDDDPPPECSGISRDDLGWPPIYFRMKQVWCEDPDCERCRRRRGGSSFHWVGPWTCLTVIGDGVMTSDEIWNRFDDCTCELCGPLSFNQSVHT